MGRIRGTDFWARVTCGSGGAQWRAGTDALERGASGHPRLKLGAGMPVSQGPVVGFPQLPFAEAGADAPLVQQIPLAQIIEAGSDGIERRPPGRQGARVGAIGLRRPAPQVVAHAGEAVADAARQGVGQKAVETARSGNGVANSR